jgi:hypothetical protein
LQNAQKQPFQFVKRAVFLFPTGERQTQKEEPQPFACGDPNKISDLHLAIL